MEQDNDFVCDTIRLLDTGVLTKKSSVGTPRAKKVTDHKPFTQAYNSIDDAGLADLIKL